VIEDKYGRVDIPADAECLADIRQRWHGKIVSYEGGCWWSLAGRPAEGMGLAVPDDWVRELTPDELVIADLLAETFWERDEYTEDLTALQDIQREMQK
jgi:L-asparaginase II